MKRILSVILVLLPIFAMAQIEPSSLRVNRLDTPTGVSPEEPVVFSWIAKSTDKNASQSAYEIRVFRNGVPVWFSGVVQSSESVAVPYEGKLHPDSRYTWSLRIWDNKGRASKTVKSSWQTGLKAENWQAELIGRRDITTPINLRTEATLTRKIKRATAYITSHGQYEAFINGERVGDAYMTPGWTSYNKRLQYQAYDVTSMLQVGENAVAAVVTPGWYTGIGFTKRRNYGDDLSLLMQINVEYTNGEKAIIATNDSWVMSSTPKALRVQLLM